MKKPTRQELHDMVANSAGNATVRRASRLALDLMDENERLTAERDALDTALPTPTTEQLEEWARADVITRFPTVSGERTAAARIALSALSDNRVLREQIGEMHRIASHFGCKPPTPSPLLDDALWRRIVAAGVVIAVRATNGVVRPTDLAEMARFDADALFAEMRGRDKP